MSAQERKIDFEIRPTDPTSFGRLQEIFDACFGRKVDAAYFDWKYRRNPAGPVAAFEALDQGRVAAFYGILPEIYLEDGQERRVYQSMDTMTHPDYQRLGLFSRLANATYSSVAEREGELRLIGIPGIRALPGFKKLGWKHAHSFPFVFQHAALLSWRSSRGYEFRPVASGAPELAEYFAARVPLRKGFEKKYDLRFFEWRVLEHPYRRLELLGCFKNGKLEGLAVSEKIGEGRRLVLLLDAIRPELRREIALALLPALARRAPFDLLYAWQPTEAELAGAFRSLHFLKNPLGRGPFSHRVPLILHLVGGGSSRRWLDPAELDLQALNQD